MDSSRSGGNPRLLCDRNGIKTLERHVPSSVWEAHREFIQAKYMVQQYTASDLQKALWEERRFDIKVPALKQRLRQWGLRRSLNEIDAAFILRLIRQAEAQNITLEVRCRNRVKTLSQISAYIKRSGKFATEADLLAFVAVDDEIPTYITYEVLSNTPGELESQEPHITYPDTSQSLGQQGLQETHHQSSGVPLLTLPQAALEANPSTSIPEDPNLLYLSLNPSHVLDDPAFPGSAYFEPVSRNGTKGEPASRFASGFPAGPNLAPSFSTNSMTSFNVSQETWLNDSSSVSSLMVDRVDSDNAVPAERPESQNGALLGVQSLEVQSNVDFGIATPQQTFVQMLQENTNGHRHLVQQLMKGHVLERSGSPSKESHSLLSLTPPAIVNVQDYSHGGIGTIQMSDVEAPIIDTNMQELRFPASSIDVSSSSAAFLSYCLGACMWRGQECSSLEDEYIDVAMGHFEHMVVSEDHSALPSLNNLVAMLEAHAQQDMACVILKRTRDIAIKWGEGDLLITIDMLKTTTQRGSTADVCTSDQMRLVQRNFETKFGKRSKPALAAAYNIAWLLTQEAQEDAAKYDEALDILEAIKAPCEHVFGPFDHQTTSVSATLARVYYRKDHAAFAEYLITELIGKLMRTHEPYDPCLLEARSRQAHFLRKLNKIAEAEQTLREVVAGRIEVLGLVNPKTQESFRDLEELLRHRTDASEVSRELDNILHSFASSLEEDNIVD